MLRRVTKSEATHYEMTAISEQASLLVFSYDAASKGTDSVCYYNRIKDTPDYSMNGAAVIGMDDMGAQEKTGISYADAKSQADALLHSAGLSADVAAAYLVNDTQDGSVDGIVEEARNYAYRFFYTRTVNGIPVAMDATSEPPAEGYSILWGYERIQVTVDRNGIDGLYWRAPITIDSIEKDRVEVLSFAQAQEVFEKMMPINYTPMVEFFNSNEDLKENTLMIDGDLVQLCLLRVREQNTEGARYGILTPAWVFYGSVFNRTKWSDGMVQENYRGSDMTSGSVFYEGPTIILAINAIDGSIIDVAQGY